MTISKKALTKNFNQTLTAVLIFTSRLGFLPANFNPLGSFGFFSNPWLFFLSIIIFDQFVGGRYPGFHITYLAFASYPFFGWLSGKMATRWSGITWLLIPFASFSFFLISNLGVWWYWYPKTLEGLLLCFTLALPFYQRTLLGDLFFGWGYLIVKMFSKDFSFLNQFQLIFSKLRHT